METEQIDRRPPVLQIEWNTDAVRKLIRATKCPTSSDAEFDGLMMVAIAKRLNPLTGQIHFVKRRTKRDNGQWEDVWSYQVGIDGLRAIAIRTGQYAGQDETELLYQGDKLIGARTKIYRKDIERPFIAVAYFDEYAQKTTDGLTRMWKEKPRLMISKCSEALGLRKAFPDDLDGLNIPEEFNDEPQAPPRLVLDSPALPEMGAATVPPAVAAPAPASSLAEAGAAVVKPPLSAAAPAPTPKADQRPDVMSLLAEWTRRLLEATTVEQIEAVRHESKADGRLSKAELNEMARGYSEAKRRIASIPKKITITGSDGKPIDTSEPAAPAPCAECGLAGAHQQGCPVVEGV